MALLPVSVTLYGNYLLASRFHLQFPEETDEVISIYFVSITKHSIYHLIFRIYLVIHQTIYLQNSDSKILILSVSDYDFTKDRSLKGYQFGHMRSCVGTSCTDDWPHRKKRRSRQTFTCADQVKTGQKYSHMGIRTGASREPNPISIFD